jgi:hypothetical protein
MIKKDSILYGSFVFIAFSAFAWMYFALIDGDFINRPIMFDSSILQTTQESYHPGEMVSVHWKFCKGTDASASITGNLVNGFNHYFPTIVGVRPEGCYDGIDSLGYIPPNIPSEHLGDDFHITLKVIYKVNFMKEKEYRFETNKFIIDK